MEKHGFGLSRKEILLVVFVVSNSFETPLHIGRSNTDWLLSSMNLSIKRPQVSK